MAIAFNAAEVLKIAIQIEQNGARFYRKVAQGIEDQQLKSKFVELAEREDDHGNTFAQMQLQLTKAQSADTVFDPEGQNARYLQALADRRVFDIAADPTDKLTGNEEIGDIFRMAIEAEKNSIVFYLGLENMVPAELGKNKLKEVISEEMRHVAQLREEFAALG